MSLLDKLEKRTAKAFLVRGIHDEFKWPTTYESTEDFVQRKKWNSTFLARESKRANRKKLKKETSYYIKLARGIFTFFLV